MTGAEYAAGFPCKGLNGSQLRLRRNAAPAGSKG
jgi:hypothetical protein